MGRGWKPHIWENLGWHYSVGIKYATVHATKYDGKVSGYWATVNAESQFTARGNDPRKAFRKALAASDAALKRWNEARADLAKAEGRAA